MKGNVKVTAALNGLLKNELAAVDQYFIHSRMYEDMGLSKMHERMSHEMEEETEHCDLIIKRLLFLEFAPNMKDRRDLLIGDNVQTMLENDLVLEMEVVGAVKEAIVICEQEKDYQSREVLETLLADTEEDHVYWLEQQLRLIKHVGIQNYIQSQM